MKKNDYKIFAIGHRNFSLPDCLKKNKHYKKLNISKINPIMYRIFSEWVGMKYVYESDDNPEYVGFCHYRRFIFDNLIDLKNDSIQYFYHYGYDDNNKICIDTLNYEYYKYNKFFRANECILFPEFIFNDVEEYFKKQDIFNYDDIIDKLNSEDYVFIAREQFICSYDKFCEMYEFVNDYIKFIEKKYDIKSDEDWKQHIIDNIIPYYKSIKYRPPLFWESEKDYNNIYKKDYGFKSKVCNQWRVYSYIIESLISLFINFNNNHFTYLNDNINGLWYFNYINIYNDTVKKQDCKNILVINDDFYPYILNKCDNIKTIDKIDKYTVRNLNNKKYDYVFVSIESLEDVMNLSVKILDDTGYFIVKVKKENDKLLTLYKEVMKKQYKILDSYIYDENYIIMKIKFKRL